MAHFDYLLVGGGLQNALIALALRARRPATRICLIERGHAVGGNHLWCFHAQDLPPGASEFVDPLIVRRWAGYDVKFPSYERRFDQPYAAISSERLDKVVRQKLLVDGSELRTGTRVEQSSPHEVRLDDGRTLSAEVVVDSRGPEALAGVRNAGYQKFVGLELLLDEPWERELPLLMDATVEQVDGFRFMYALPLSESRVLVEDTYFSEDDRLDRAELRARVLKWAESAGLRARAIDREEAGVLPLPARIPKLELTAPLRGGYSGGWFHPTTGYSFPAAVRLADHVSRVPARDLFGERFAALASAHKRQLGLAVLLNRVMFDAFDPAKRRNVFEYFHRLPPELVTRFYGLQLAPADALQLMRAGPPRGFSLMRALRKARAAVAEAIET